MTLSVPVPETPSHPADGGASPRVAYFHSYWAAGPQIILGASDYWRLAIPAAALLDNGWDVMLARCVASGKDGTLHVQDPTGQWHDDREVIVWHCWMSEGTAEAIRRARAMGQVIINDVDDDYWNIPEGHVARSRIDPRQRPEYNSQHYCEIIAASTLVTTSTPCLAERLETIGPPVRVVRNYIDLDAWRPQPPGSHVGWVGLLPWRDSDLRLLRDTAVPWLRARDRFFYHGGSVDMEPSAQDELGYDRVTTRPPTDVFYYPRLWDPLRVALVPLRDSAFNGARSWVKGLEAMARGVPFVASDHPEYRELGATRLVERPGDWERHLDELEDEDLAAAEGLANRARAERLTIREHWPEWADALTGAASLRSG